jgi:hypothetical protein
VNVTVIRRVLWVAAAGALGGATVAFWNWWPIELVISAGMFVVLIPIDMLLRREEIERRLPPHGPVRKWGMSEDAIHSRLGIRPIARRTPWWWRMYRRLVAGGAQ